MVEPFLVHHVEGLEHLADVFHGLLLAELTGTLIERTARDEVHHVVARMVGIEHVAHANDVGMFELVDAVGFVAKLSAQFFEEGSVVLIADDDARGVLVAMGDAVEEKLFDHHAAFLSRELGVFGQIGVATAAAREIAFNAIASFEQSAGGEHVCWVDFGHKC